MENGFDGRWGLHTKFKSSRILFLWLLRSDCWVWLGVVVSSQGNEIQKILYLLVCLDSREHLVLVSEQLNRASPLVSECIHGRSVFKSIITASWACGIECEHFWGRRGRRRDQLTEDGGDNQRQRQCDFNLICVTVVQSHLFEINNLI